MPENAAEAGPLAEWTALANAPRFACAARRLAGNMLAACDADERLCGVFKDAGRYITAMSAAYLHGAGGLTLPRLKQICAASGFLSSGRARALLQFLLHIGYLEAAGRAERAVAYLPTESFVRAWRHHLALALDAALLIDPGIVTLLGRFAEPGVYEVMIGIQARRLHALARKHEPVSALRRAFLDHYAGSQLLWVLVVATDAGTFPPSDRFAISLAGVARRFGVSHVHVRRLLEGARAGGLIEYDGYGIVAFTDVGKDQVQVHYASQLHELVATAHEVIPHLPG